MRSKIASNYSSDHPLLLNSRNERGKEGGIERGRWRKREGERLWGGRFLVTLVAVSWDAKAHL